MTAQQSFHHFGRRPSRIALSGIVPVALVHDVDLVARRCRFSPVIGWSGRGVGLAHGIRLRLRCGLGKGRRQGALALNFLTQQPPKAVVNAPNPHDKAWLLDELLDARIEQAVVVRHMRNRIAALLQRPADAGHVGGERAAKHDAARLQCFDHAPVVGYGASFGGIAAPLGMLNSYASGVSVVNIDNGFSATNFASLINHL